MELERFDAKRPEAAAELEAVVIGVGIQAVEWRALRAFQAEVERATSTHWIEAGTVDNALGYLRLLQERGSLCVGLIGAGLGEREVLRFVRSLAGRGRSAAVVVLAGRQDEELVTAALAASACDFLNIHELDVDCLVRSIRLAAEVARGAREAEARTVVERDLEERFSAVWDLVDDGLLLVDEQRFIRRYNRAAKRLLGLSDADLDGAPFGSLRWESSADGAGGLAGLSAREIPAMFERPDGSRIRLGVRVRVFHRRVVPGGRLRAVVLRDRSETPAHQELLADAQQFAGIGRHLAGAAHDANNLLTPLLGYCDLLLAGLPPGSHLERYATEVERSARRAADLLRRLLEQSRARPLEMRPVLADHAVTEIAGLLRSLVGSPVEISSSLGAPELAVALREGQIEQVVLNLAANSRDAMPRGGRLEIRTFAENGSLWVLEVVDTGSGIPPENMDRLFDPSFTSKASGKGTGLGLWIVRSIVQEAGGRVRISSLPGRGTTVRIELPATPASPGTAPIQGTFEETGKTLPIEPLPAG
ncbi:MAG: ATP-binding protein [Thermoanaerobaculia bacterium]